MKPGIKISIPSPCHEDWAKMAPANRGRFCAVCQKTVVDFTNTIDRDIISAYNKSPDLCGRFRDTQLSRDLVIPKKKNSLWAGTATAIALLALGSGEALAQAAVQTEQSQTKGKVRISDTTKHYITGTVKDKEGIEIPGAVVGIIGSDKMVMPDIEGNFSIEAVSGSILYFDAIGYEKQEYVLNNEDELDIVLKEDETEGVVITNYIITQRYVSDTVCILPLIKAEKKRTFLGRIFHAIGNIFR